MSFYSDPRNSVLSNGRKSTTAGAPTYQASGGHMNNNRVSIGSTVSTVSTGKKTPILGPNSFQAADRTSVVSQGPKKSTVNRRSNIRNGLDHQDNYSISSDRKKISTALQTCKDTGVGDCPACLGSRNPCHENECELCCQSKTCGPEYNHCPFRPAIEVQTDPLCEFSSLPCRCENPCGFSPCLLAEGCEFTDMECRCTERSCNTSRHCIIVDEESDLCEFSDVYCKCIDRGCSTTGTCIIYEEECESPFPYNQGEDLYSNNQDASCQTDVIGFDPYLDVPETNNNDDCGNEVSVSNGGTNASFDAKQSTAAVRQHSQIERSATRQPSIARQNGTPTGPSHASSVAAARQTHASFVAARQSHATDVGPVRLQSAVPGGTTGQPYAYTSQSLPPDARPSCATGSFSIRQSGAPSPSGYTRQSTHAQPDSRKFVQATPIVQMPGGVQAYQESNKRRKFCKEELWDQPHTPLIGEFVDTRSIHSDKHSVFKDMSKSPVTCNGPTEVDQMNDYPIEDNIDDEMNDGDYHVTIDEIPTPSGQISNRISISIPQATSSNSKSRTNTSAARTLSTKRIASKERHRSMTSKPQSQVADVGRSISQVLNSQSPGIISPKSNVLTPTTLTETPKSQVHFDIDILGNAQNRTIVFRRSLQHSNAADLIDQQSIQPDTST